MRKVLLLVRIFCTLGEDGRDIVEGADEDWNTDFIKGRHLESSTCF